MTWRCAFKRLYTIAVNLGYTGLCAPKNFNELWCLIDSLTALSGGTELTLASTDDDLVLGPWAEDRQFVIIADAGNSDSISYNLEGELPVSILAGASTTDTVPAGDTVTIIAPGTGSRSVKYFVLVA